MLFGAYRCSIVHGKIQREGGTTSLVGVPDQHCSVCRPIFILRFKNVISKFKGAVFDPLKQFALFVIKRF